MLIDPKHEILSERCRLRYPNEKDIPYIWSATRVAGFNDGMLWEPPKHIGELDEPLRRAEESWAEGDSFTWTIETRDADEFVGRISIRTEPGIGAWSIGFWIHPSVQGRGYATEAAKAIVEFGFAHLDARIITAAHATWNEASGRVLRHTGMRKVRLNPRGFRKKGEWVEEYEYEILAD